MISVYIYVKYCRACIYTPSSRCQRSSANGCRPRLNSSSAMAVASGAKVFPKPAKACSLSSSWREVVAVGGGEEWRKMVLCRLCSKHKACECVYKGFYTHIQYVHAELYWLK